jgi:hypothetical protein
MENAEIRMVVVVVKGEGEENGRGCFGRCINGSKERFAGLHFDEIKSWSCWECRMRRSEWWWWW